MATPIGGYFELEPNGSPQQIWKPKALKLQSGRGCLRFLIQQFRPTTVHLPYFACDALAQPFLEQGIQVKWYSINELLEPAAGIVPSQMDEAFVYVNYFGLRESVARQLPHRAAYWIDNTHAFFAVPEHPETIAFNSARKMFGVPDGSFLFGLQARKSDAAALTKNENFRTEHLLFRMFGSPESGKRYFDDNEKRCGLGCHQMSNLTQTILDRVDMGFIKRRRRENFETLHAALGSRNCLHPEILRLKESDVPYCYPFLPSYSLSKQYFWARKVFIPVLWNECLTRTANGFNWEKDLTRRLLPLPIDHRYNAADMVRLIEAIDHYHE